MAATHLVGSIRRSLRRSVASVNQWMGQPSMVKALSMPLAIVISPVNVANSDSLIDKLFPCSGSRGAGPSWRLGIDPSERGP